MKGNPLYYATGLSVIFSFLFAILVLAFRAIPEENRELFIHILGIIEGAFVGNLVSSFFGSSKKEHETHDAEVTITKTESNS